LAEIEKVHAKPTEEQREACALEAREKKTGFLAGDTDIYTNGRFSVTVRCV
jgi:hypothetical protein